MTMLQQAAYNAQLAAGLPISRLAGTVLIRDAGIIDHQHCASYIHAVQQMDWFRAAFPGHAASCLWWVEREAATPTLCSVGSRSAPTADTTSVHASRHACMNWRIS